MNNPDLQQKWLATANGKICYFLRQEQPSRPTAIFLHGLSSNHTTWPNVMETLSKKGYNSLSPDLRGHGFSDKTKKNNLYRLSVFSDDLSEILKQEQIDDFILVGYSFGGQIAMDYVIKHPKRAKGLILISASHANPLEYRHLKLSTPLFIGALNLLAGLFIWQKRKNYHYYRHGRATGYWDSVKDGLRTMPLSVNFWLLANQFKINFKKEIQQIKIPTIIIGGQKDIIVTRNEIDDMARAIPQSKIIISKNPSHFVGTNAQDEITQIILDFLRNLSA